MGLQNFPWRIYLRFVFLQALVLFGAFSAFVWALNRFANGALSPYLPACLVFGAGFIFAFSLWIGREFFLPLGRLIQKSRVLLSRRSGRTAELDDVMLSTTEEEWHELDRMLDRVQTDLHRTTDRLSRGREETNTLMSAISDAIIAVDPSGQPLFYNAQFEKQFGGGNSQARLGEFFRAPDVLESFRRVFATQQSVQTELSLQPLLAKEWRDYQLAVAPLRLNDSDRVYGALGIFHDVTDLKRAERIRIEFVANASHELRTPLTSVKGYVETLRVDLRAGRTQGADRFIDVIARNVDRLIHLVNDLLALSALEGHSVIEKKLLNVRELTEAVLKNLDNDRNDKNQLITTDYSAQQVCADLAKVEQVLTNLVQNAIKYTPSSGRIEVIWRASENGATELLVRDNGPGIAAKHLSRIFERFYRIDPSRSREQGGTGLGLAIVKHILLRHGGSVSVSSELGKGTEFVCRFPGI